MSRSSTVTLPPVPPDRSHEQRLEALESANDIRVRRAKLKRDIRAGRRSALEMLERPPDVMLTMKVLDLLLVIPSVGTVKANKLLAKSQISPSKTLGGLSDRQRDMLSVRMRVNTPPYVGRNGNNGL